MTRTSTWLVANDASGSNDETALSAIEAILNPGRVLDAGSHDLPDRRALERAGVDRLVVFAGDGTVNAVVSGLQGWGGQVLVLPGGTANLLAKALHGERGALDVLRDLERMFPIRRSCIRSSCGLALIELLAGPGASWSDVREGLREGDVAELAARTVEAVRLSTVGPMVAILEPQIGREQGYAGVRLCPGDDVMTVSGYGAETAADYFRQGLALLRRDFREGPHDDLGTHRQIVVRSLEDQPVDLMIDGERRTGTPQERFLLAQLPVNLLATRR